MKFVNIYKETEENMRLALLSLWAPGNHPMGPAINKLLMAEPLLAEPVFQSTFGWEPTNTDEWRKYLNPHIVQKLGIGAEYKPYKHQAESWKALADNKSIVVTSGTGSGKTECFMYPVLSDLYEQKSTNSIQAIFLYPLNALMEDQKKRLSKYCKATGLKFAVYNGDTKEYRADGGAEGLDNEVCTRDEIRDINNIGTRPQILLTNPSMLEYILVREKDQKMLQQSAKKLRWIVIDEAHSYSGSAAVELAYQIKRILSAFDKDATEVRFACTSATIGGGEGAQSLAEFISTITGQPISLIKVIGGNRLIPELDSVLLESTLTEKKLPSIEKVLRLREQINSVAGMTLMQIWEWLKPSDSFALIPALELVDQLCELSQGKSPVLSLRAHFFMRAISGLYGCANNNCEKTSDTPYGHLTTFKSLTCPSCVAPLLEIVQCKRCGSFILMGESDSQTNRIKPCDDVRNLEDYFSIDLTPEQETVEEEETVGSPNRFFLFPYDKENSFNPVSKAHLQTVNLKHTLKNSVLEIDSDDNGIWVDIRKDDGHSYCSKCGKLAMGRRLNFKHFRIPVNFINQTIAPVFLRECAPEGRSWGKYIAFTDSRQGTAISAKAFNINVERIRCRQNLVEMIAKQDGAIKSDDELLNTLPPYAKAYLENADEKVKKELLETIRKASTNGNTSNDITLEKVSDNFFDKTIFKHITITDGDPDEKAYKASLLRQTISRKSLYENNMETMGLMTIEYPQLSKLNKPTALMDYEDRSNITIEVEEWRNYLKIILDYFFRAGNHIQPLIDGERKYIRDTSLSSPICGPDDDRHRITRWPSVNIDNDNHVSINQSRLISLLCAGLGISSLEKLQEKHHSISMILNDAWAQLVDAKILTKVNADDNEGYNDPRFYSDNRFVGCYYLDLSGRPDNFTARIVRTKKCWICPVTNKLLDTTFCGYSPLINGELNNKTQKMYFCGIQNTVDLPQRPADSEQIEDWLLNDTNVNKLKELGLWSDRHNDSYRIKRSYIAAEHSAQQSKELLRVYTKAFSQNNPSINVLHCSTTMEMGVDIGDIDVVVMDTIPPTAANYLQRVGRAGRMGQSKAIAFSLCNNTPVGQYAFTNPMWALKTTNHMIKVRESQTIIQRHVNSYFFRKFICENGQGIQATMTIDDFITTTLDPFINFLEAMRTNKIAESKFHDVFGQNIRYTIDITKKCIKNVANRYLSVIKELEEAFIQHPDDEKRKIAISIQIKKCKQENLLNYLSDNQFIPNANMPTGVVTFDFTDRDQSNKLHRLYNELERLRSDFTASESETEKYAIKSGRGGIDELVGSIEQIKRSTTASRDIHTALNEYAPEQTVVVNEKNYVSAGVILFGAYNETTQTRAIYHCTSCGHTDYSNTLDEGKKCPLCNHRYRSIIDRDNEGYTLAYAPIGFRTDQNVHSSREEKTDKHYYDIRPVLLKTDWAKPSKVNMCEVINSGDNGAILFYNVGNGLGFAFCKRCGRAAVEISRQMPNLVKPGHDRLWGDLCDANEKDIARNVVFTGEHNTCYSVIRFQKDVDSKEYETDEQLVYTLGVIIRRALAKSDGIDEGEIDFGIKQEENAWVLFVYDTAKGGCGYSLKLSNPTDCQTIFEIARKDLLDSTCTCEDNGGACTKCLVDRSNFRYANKLSKSKALNWLTTQKEKSRPVPSEILDIYPAARNTFRSLKTILTDAIDSINTSSLTLCVSDISSDYAVTDWYSVKSEMGRYIYKALEKGIKVNIKVEYHPEFHQSLGDKLPFIDIDTKFPDCDIDLIQSMGAIKTALIVCTDKERYRYFTSDIHALSFSNNWGSDCKHLYSDSLDVTFSSEVRPVYIVDPSEVVREGITTVSSFKVSNYFSEAIAPILKSSDIDLLEKVLKGKNVDITFSDMFVNSALASLMLVYLIKELQTLFRFNILDISLQLDSQRRRCNNEKFNGYTYISNNFDSCENADRYTDELIMDVFDIDPEHSFLTADHHRWLKLVTSDGSKVEIRPDHGISGGWTSQELYKNLDKLDGNVRVIKKNEDVLYYVIIKNSNNCQ